VLIDDTHTYPCVWGDTRSCEGSCELGCYGRLPLEAWERMTDGGMNLHWVNDCARWRGVLLVGEKRHWCNDWDGLPIDETCREFPCACFPLERYASR